MVRAKFIMKNGCCRDCMKAFSKNGKVRLFWIIKICFRAVSVKSLDFRGEPLCQGKAASIAGARAATQSTLGVISVKRSRTSWRRRAKGQGDSATASIWARDRDCLTQMTKSSSWWTSLMTGTSLRRISKLWFKTWLTLTLWYLVLESQWDILPTS